MELARMVMKPTRATPIIRADAVAAVRRGLRRAFSIARWPVAPDTLVGRPSTFMTGRAITGARTNTPKMRSSTPRPRSWRAPGPEPAMPAPKATAPPPVMARPNTVRFSEALVSSMAVSRSAAMGLMRLALRAGPIDESSVTETPTTKAVMTVPDVMTTSPLGISRPTAPRSARRPKDMPTPASRPSAEATIPTMADSNSTARSTCRRLAPTARSIAISRMRWAMMIEKVL